MSLNYSLQRYRPNGTTAQPISTEPGVFGSSDPFNTTTIVPVTPQPAQSQARHQPGLRSDGVLERDLEHPVRHHQGSFLQQQIVLQRDLHDWRASFTFTKNTNGNFALYFTVYLISLPEIKFDYNQTDTPTGADLAMTGPTLVWAPASAYTSNLKNPIGTCTPSKTPDADDAAEAESPRRAPA